MIVVYDGLPRSASKIRPYRPSFFLKMTQEKAIAFTMLNDGSSALLETCTLISGYKAMRIKQRTAERGGSWSMSLFHLIWQNLFVGTDLE